MRDYAGGKNQPCFLRGGIDRSQEAAPGEPGAAGLGINRDLAHSAIDQLPGRHRRC